MKITAHHRVPKVKELCDHIFSNLPELYVPVLQPKTFLNGVSFNTTGYKEIYTIDDHYLRYDLTRYQLNQPPKNGRAYGPVFRNENTSNSRWRQFYQYDCDNIHAKEGLSLLSGVYKLVASLIGGYTLKVNCLKLLREFIPVTVEAAICEKVTLKLTETDKKRYQQLFWARYPEIIDFKPANLAIVVDPNYTRSHDYYTGLVFEVKPDGLKHAIVGGGVYMRPDKVEMFGFGIGISRIDYYDLYQPKTKPAVGIIFKTECPKPKALIIKTAFKYAQIRYVETTSDMPVRRLSLKLQKLMKTQNYHCAMTLIVDNSAQYSHSFKGEPLWTGNLKELVSRCSRACHDSNEQNS